MFDKNVRKENELMPINITGKKAKVCLQKNFFVKIEILILSITYKYSFIDRMINH
jgi:hypothetical protein